MGRQESAAAREGLEARLGLRRTPRRSPGRIDTEPNAAAVSLNKRPAVVGGGTSRGGDASWPRTGVAAASTTNVKIAKDVLMRRCRRLSRAGRLSILRIGQGDGAMSALGSLHGLGKSQTFCSAVARSFHIR